MSVFHRIPPLPSDVGRLVDLVPELPFAANVQDTVNDKYIVTNVHLAKNQGIAHPNEIVGMSFNELAQSKKRNCSRHLLPPYCLTSTLNCIEKSTIW